MNKRIRIPLIVAGCFLLVWWAFFNHVKENKYEEYPNTAQEAREELSQMYYYMGKLALKRGDFSSAIQAFLDSKAAQPEWLDVYDCLGAAYELNKQPEEALKTYAQAMAINPNFIEHRFSKGVKFDGTLPLDPKRFGKAKPWEGEDLAKKKIIVASQKGLGDTIMFSRFLKDLAQRYPQSKIYFSPQEPLYELMHSFIGWLQEKGIINVELVNKEQSLESLEADYYISLLSLHHLLALPYKDISPSEPYMRATTEKIEALKRDYFSNKNFKLGIVWQGDPKHINDKKRSIPLSFFYRFSTMPNVMVYSLQKGFGSEQLDQLPSKVSIINLGQHLNNFSDTAAVIANLDLLISIDSSVAHLAGALGKETLLLLPYITDWRWLGYQHNPDTIWYPSVKKIQQEAPDQWEKVFTMASSIISQKVFEKAQEEKRLKRAKKTIQ